MRFPFVRTPEEDGIDARHSATLSERTLTQLLITSTNRFIPAVVCFEVGSQLFKFGFASLAGNDALLSEYDGLCPLHVREYTYVIFYSSSVSFFESRTFYASISDIPTTINYINQYSNITLHQYPSIIYSLFLLVLSKAITILSAVGKLAKSVYY
jgi:hypothetical protein